MSCRLTVEAVACVVFENSSDSEQDIFSCGRLSTDLIVDILVSFDL